MVLCTQAHNEMQNNMVNRLARRQISSYVIMAINASPLTLSTAQTPISSFRLVQPSPWG